MTSTGSNPVRTAEGHWRNPVALCGVQEPMGW